MKPIMKPKKLNSVASSFWLDDELNEKLIDGKQINYTKLAATQRAIGNFVNIVTGKKIPVVFQSGNDSYTDGKQVVIGSKIEGANFDPAVGLALHEGSHIAFTDFKMFQDNATDIKNSKFASVVRMYGVDPDFTLTNDDFRNIKDLLNYVEDRRIDYKIYSMAPGYRPYYEAMYNKYFNDKIIDKALIKGEKVQENWDCYMFHIINLTNPNRQLSSLKYLQTIWDTIDLANIGRLQTTTDALAVAVDIFKTIKQAVKEAEAEQSANQTQTQPPSDESFGNGGGAGEITNDDNELDAEQIELTVEQVKEIVSKLSENDQRKLNKAVQNQRSFLNGEQKKEGKLSKTQNRVISALRASGTEVRTIEYTGSNGGDIGSIDTVVIKKLNDSIISVMPDLFSTSKRTTNENLASISKGIILGKHLGKKLQVRNADKTLKVNRLETGKIDRSLLAQLGFGNDNVFHRIVTDKYKNFFIHISIDASGSMAGNKWDNALISAVAIAQAASMTTGIRVQISTRGTSCSLSGRDQSLTMYVYDSAHDNMSKIKKYFKYLSTYGCTPEGVAFKSIEKDLILDAKGDEKIFINYSDGAPSHVYGMTDVYSNDGPVLFTKRVINNFRRSGISIISYFISYKHQNTYLSGDKTAFREMYGADSNFIDPVNMSQIAKSLNSKFTETV